MEYSISERPQSNLPKIKIFQTIQKSFIFIGIELNSAMHTHPLNAKILLGLSVLSLALASNLIFISKDAEELVEYTLSIFVCCDLILIILEMIILICKSSELNKLISDCENLSNTREHQSNIWILISNLIPIFKNFSLKISLLFIY